MDDSTLLKSGVAPDLQIFTLVPLAILRGNKLRRSLDFRLSRAENPYFTQRFLVGRRREPSKSFPFLTPLGVRDQP